MNVGAFAAVGRKEAAPFHFRLVGRGKVRAAAKEVRQVGRKLVEHVAARCAGGLRAFRRKEAFVRKQSLRQLCAVPGEPFGVKLGISGPIAFKHGVISRVLLGACLCKRFIMRIDFGGDFELVVRPAHRGLHRGDVLLAERFAVGARFALLGRAFGDVRAHDDEGRLFRFGLRGFDGNADGIHILAVVHGDHLPAVSCIARGYVLRKGGRGIALDGDAVAVIERDELAELLRAGKACGFGSRAFHHAAVAHEHKGVVIHDGETFAVELRGHVRFRHRHADGHRKALAERARCGFHACGVAVFRVAGRAAAGLAEVFEVIHREAVSVKVKQRVFQHGSMPCGKHEAVPPEPGRVLRVVLHLFPERICHRSGADGHAGVAAVGLLDGIRREHADR